MVDARARPDGGDNARWNRNHHRDEHRRKRELDGRRQTSGNRRRHAFVGPERHAKIATRHAHQERRVLHVQGAVQTEAGPQFDDAFRRRCIAEHRLHRIAGDEMNERKHERRDAQQDGNGKQQPANEKPGHGCPS